MTGLAALVERGSCPMCGSSTLIQRNLPCYYVVGCEGCGSSAVSQISQEDARRVWTEAARSRLWPEWPHPGRWSLLDNVRLNPYY